MTSMDFLIASKWFKHILFQKKMDYQQAKRLQVAFQTLTPDIYALKLMKPRNLCYLNESNYSGGSKRMGYAHNWDQFDGVMCLETGHVGRLDLPSPQSVLSGQC